MITQEFHNATHRTAIPPANRRHLRTFRLAEKYNTVRVTCGTPAARRWLPQALAFRRTENAVRCAAEWLRTVGN